MKIQLIYLVLLFSSLSGFSQKDISFVGDVNGDGKEDLVLVNTNYTDALAIRVINVAVGSASSLNLAPPIPHGSFGGWMDATDKMFLGDVNADGHKDLVLVNTGGTGYAIKAIDIMTGNQIGTPIPHGSFGGWMDATDKMFLGDVAGDAREELILVNTYYSGYAIRVLDLATGIDINLIPHGTFGGWMDPDDRMFLANPNGGVKKELVMINTDYIGAAVRSIDLTNGSIVSNVNLDGTISQINNGLLVGWLDKSDWIDIKDVNNDNKEDLILISTSYTGGAILTLDLMSGALIKWINHTTGSGTFSSWMDPCDRWFITDVNNDNFNDLVLVNTTLTGGAIRCVNLITGTDIYPWVNHGSFLGWMDNSDLICSIKTTPGSKKGTVMFVSSDNNSGQIRVVDPSNAGSNDYWWNFNQFSPDFTLWDNNWSYNCIGNNSPPDFSNSTNQNVYLENNIFYNNGTPFYPKVMNYMTNIISDDGINFRFLPHHSFSSNNLPCCSNQTYGDAALRYDMKKIADMGFNTIRLIGFDVASDSLPSNNWMRLPVLNSLLNSTTYLDATNSSHRTIIFNGIQKVLDAAKDNGLKVILLTGHDYVFRTDVSPQYTTYLAALANNFKYNRSIFAYDMFNEPELSKKLYNYDLYNYNIYTKSYTCSTVNSWYNTIKANDPNHLITIGNWGDYEIDQWDPKLMTVDFLSFHIYPEHAKSDYKEYYTAYIKWISSNVSKPWILGETGYSAINIDGSGHHIDGSCEINPLNTQQGWGNELTQQDFADFSFNLVRACNGAGYSFWAYHDVYHDNATISENYEGLLSRCHRVKPVASIFFKDGYDKPCCNCPQPSDYYYYNYDVALPYTFSGTVKNPSGMPVSGAIVVGSYNTSTNSYGQVRTKTKSDGSYIIKSTYPITSISATALGYSNYKDYVPTANIILKQFTSCANPPRMKNLQESENIDNELITIFPNPSSGIVNIQNNGSINSKIKIFDISGKLIIERELAPVQDKIDLSLFLDGIYFISIEKDGVRVQTKKIVLAKP